MNTQKRHQHALKGLQIQLKNMLDTQQGMYVYLDDQHKLCNAAFAKLLGYSSPAQWAQQQGPFLESLVYGRSQQQLAIAYTQATDKKIASSVPITWKRKNGKTVSTMCILVPIRYDGLQFVIHFITKK